MSMTLGIGRALHTLVALATSIGCYVADYNETHVFNPKWPPHAKFHNGQTMSLGLTLGLITLFFTWKTVFFSSTLPSISSRDSAFVATLIGSLYWMCGISAILYPGTTWLDPEFQKDPSGPPEPGPQRNGFIGLIGFSLLGLFLTIQGLDQKSKRA